MDPALKATNYRMSGTKLYYLLERQLLYNVIGNVTKENYQCHAMNIAFQIQQLWYTDTYTQQFRQCVKVGAITLKRP